MDNYPLVRLVPSFTLGILIQNYLELPLIIIILGISILLVIFILLLILQNSSIIWLNNTVLILFSFLVGSLIFQINQNMGIEYPFEKEKIRNEKIKGEIENINLITSKKVTIEMLLSHEDKDRFKIHNQQKLLCNLWRDTTNQLDLLYKKMKIGSSISLIGNISRAKDQRNPGEFNYEKYLLENGFSAIVNCYKLDDIEIEAATIRTTPNLIFSMRDQINQRIIKLHDNYASALLKGVILADRSDIDFDTKTSFINSGVVHVLAVSGLHVGFITIIFYLILGRFDIRIKLSFTILGIVLFLIITGGHPSVFRASTMAVTYIIAKLTGRSTNGLNSIAIAAAIILMLNPNDLFNPGFQLSFSAVLAILIIYPVLSKKIELSNVNAKLKKVLLFITVSIAAQFGTLPFTLIYFNKLSLISILTNLIVIPLIGIIVSIGILTLAVSIFSIWIAEILASANNLLTALLYYFVEITSRLTFSYIKIHNFSIIDGILFYFFLTILLYTLTKFKKLIIIILCFPLLFLSFINYISLDDNSLLPDGNLSVVAIDVGQGDAILIKFPNGNCALIDAGNSTEYFDNGERVIYPLLNFFGIDLLNYVFISHLDSDHYAGVISLANKGIVDTLFKPFEKGSIKDSIFNEFLSAYDITINLYSNGSMTVGNCNIYFLNDTSNFSYKNFDSNNKSGIIKIVYGKNSFLFVGDAEFEAEELLVQRYQNFLNADLLKIGHHGSKTSSSDEFLEKVDPKIGIISAGIMNKFNHPSPDIIQKYENKGVELYRTDKEGAIILTSDGESISRIIWK